MDKQNITVLTHFEQNILELKRNGNLIGLTVELLKNMEFNSNFTFTIKPQNRTYSFLQNQDGGDFFESEVEKVLLSNEVQLAGSNYNLLKSRSLNLNLLFPIIRDRISAFFIQPHPMESNSMLTGPFTFGTILLFHLSLLMICTLIVSGFVILKITSGHSRENNAITDAIWNTLSAFTLKSASIATKTNSYRTLLVTTSVFFILMHSMYSAFLMSTLTSALSPIRSLSQLLSKEYTIDSPASLIDFVKGKAVRTTNQLVVSTESLRKVFDGGHIHVAHAHQDHVERFFTALNFTIEDRRKLNDIPFISNLCSGFYISKNWTQKLREPMNRRIARLGDIGILHRYSTNYFRGSGNGIVGMRGAGFFELELVHIGKLFLLLVIISIFSIIAFLFEIFHRGRFVHESNVMSTKNN